MTVKYGFIVGTTVTFISVQRVSLSQIWMWFFNFSQMLFSVTKVYLFLNKVVLSWWTKLKWTTKKLNKIQKASKHKMTAVFLVLSKDLKYSWFWFSALWKYTYTCAKSRDLTVVAKTKFPQLSPVQIRCRFLFPCSFLPAPIASWNILQADLPGHVWCVQDS